MSGSPSRQAERDQRRGALPVRRQLAHLDAAVARAQRLDPLRTVRAEILDGQPRRGGDRLGHLAGIEARGAVALDQPQRAREVGQCVDLPDPGRRPGRTLGGGPALSNPFRRGHTALGRLDRTGEGGVEAEAPVALGQVGPAAHRARHGHRARPESVHAELGQLRRRAARGVEPVQLALPPDLREEVAADPGVARLGDAEHRRRRESSVDRVPALLEGAHPGARRQRVARRHHRVAEDGRTPHLRTLAQIHSIRFECQAQPRRLAVDHGAT